MYTAVLYRIEQPFVQPSRAKGLLQQELVCRIPCCNFYSRSVANVRLQLQRYLIRIKAVIRLSTLCTKGFSLARLQMIFSMTQIISLGHNKLM